MIGLVIVTHGRLAEEFIAVMEHVVGKQENVAAVCMAPDDDLDQKRQEIEKKVKEVNTGKGVIILTDMFGGTPSNLAIAATSDKSVEALAGINVPMLIKLASVRQTETVQKAAEMAAEAGRKYINAATALLQAGEGVSARLERTVLIVNKRGLHARAAAKFVRLVEEMGGDVTVAKDDMEVCGSSIMGLLMLSASMDTAIRITAGGDNADAVLAALEDLVSRRFDEEA